MSGQLYCDMIKNVSPQSDLVDGQDDRNLFLYEYMFNWYHLYIWCYVCCVKLFVDSRAFHSKGVVNSEGKGQTACQEETD